MVSDFFSIPLVKSKLCMRENFFFFWLSFLKGFCWAWTLVDRFLFSFNTLKIFLFFFFACSVPMKNLMNMYSIFFPSGWFYSFLCITDFEQFDNDVLVWFSSCFLCLTSLDFLDLWVYKCSLGLDIFWLLLL